MTKVMNLKCPSLVVWSHESIEVELRFSAKKRRAAEREGTGEKESSRERQLIEEAKKKTREGQVPQPSQPSRPDRPRPPPSRSSDEERPGKPQQFFKAAHDSIEQRLNNLRKQRDVQEKMNEVLLNAYEETYGTTLVEITEFGRDPEEIRPGDLVITPQERELFDAHKDVKGEPAQLLEEMPSSAIAEPFSSVFQRCHVCPLRSPAYVKCIQCGKCLNSMTISSYWQHCESKQCWPHGTMAFWRKEYAKYGKHPQARDIEAKARPSKRARSPRSADGPPPEFIPCEREDETPIRLKSVPRDEAQDAEDKKQDLHEERKAKGRSASEPAPKPKSVHPRPKVEVKRALDQATKDAVASVTNMARGRGAVHYKPKDKEEPEENDAEKSEREPDEEKSKSEEEDRPRRRDYTAKASPSRDGSSSPETLDYLGSGQSGKMDTTVVWTTVDSGAAVSCIPEEMAMACGLEVTPVQPFTTASGQPVHVKGGCYPELRVGEENGPCVHGRSMLKAMEVSKPLLSVSKLVGHGWSVNFTPGGATMSKDGKTIPLAAVGGVYKVALGFQGHPKV